VVGGEYPTYVILGNKVIASGQDEIALDEVGGALQGMGHAETFRLRDESNRGLYLRLLLKVVDDFVIIGTDDQDNVVYAVGDQGLHHSLGDRFAHDRCHGLGACECDWPQALAPAGCENNTLHISLPP
jgi:hypothetical protein